MDACSAHQLSMTLAMALFVLALTVYMTAHATKGEQDPNSLIGIRTRATKSSKEAWVAGHRVAYPYLLAGATHCLGSSVLIAAFLGFDFVPATALLIFSIVLALGAAVILTASGIKADREAKKHIHAT